MPGLPENRLITLTVFSEKPFCSLPAIWSISVWSWDGKSPFTGGSCSIPFAAIFLLRAVSLPFGCISALWNGCFSLLFAGRAAISDMAITFPWSWFPYLAYFWSSILERKNFLSFPGKQSCSMLRHFFLSVLYLRMIFISWSFYFLLESPFQTDAPIEME